ncbi:hypothetical protein [uncultured Clostridium sp.]|uniref:hypothetical protein n=1 Tax=uncultured Clostridium sp. TaxID=59620 RepID=UPI0025DBA1F5|nr:hypothetical protein [uncultured Clostridium sp.]
MNYIISFISGFQGIIGAVFGTVATLITTELIKSLGRLKFYFNDISIEYSGENERGFTDIIVTDVTKADACGYKFRVQIYNSSETIKILKDFKVEFVLESRSIYNKPNNRDEYIQHDCFLEYKDFNLIHILPKNMIEINMCGNIYNENMIEFSKLKKVYFIAQNHNNKTIKKLIKKF